MTQTNNWQANILIERIGQFLNSVFSSRDLHNRHTGNLTDTTDQILIVRSHGVNTMLRDLYTVHISIPCTSSKTGMPKNSPSPLYSRLHMYRCGHTEVSSSEDPWPLAVPAGT